MKGLARISVFICFMILLSSVSLAGAQPLEISVTPSNATVRPDTQVTYNLTIRNNQNMKDNFGIAVSGPHIEWKIPGTVLVPVEGNSLRSVDLNFVPMGREGEYSFNAEVFSYSNPEVSARETFHMNIPSEIGIKALILEKVGGELRVALDIESFYRRDVEILFKLLDSGEMLVRTLSASTGIEELQTIERSMSLEGLYPGVYYVKASVEGMEAVQSFEIEPVHNIIEKSERISNPLYDEIIITVFNYGNVIEYNYRISKPISSDSFTGFVTSPSQCYEEGETRKCDFIIPELLPGMSGKVVYRIEYWPTYAQIIVGIIAVFAVMTFGFIKITKPRIRKTYIRKSGGKHSIVLEIRNPFKRELNNVIVRDWVSPLAKVLKKEFEYLEPVIRKSEAGTELIWRLGDIKPKEVRILSYKIRGVIKGNLKMPKAYMRFKDKRGRRVRVYSRPLMIE